MSADQLVQYLSWTVFVLIFVSTAMRAARHPQRANIDIALFFSVPMAIIAIGIVAVFGLVHAGPLIDAVNTSLILAMSYMLLRIVDDFAIVPAWLMRGVGAVLAILVAGAFVFQPPRPGWLNLLMLLYLVVVLLYAASAFIRESRRSSGVTRRRMRSVAAGSILLVLLFIISSLNLVAPALRDTCKFWPISAGWPRAYATFSGSHHHARCDEPGRSPSCALSSAVRPACRACPIPRRSSALWSAAPRHRWEQTPESASRTSPSAP